MQGLHRSAAVTLRPLPRIWLNIGFALLYFVAAQISLLVSFRDLQITPVWLPSGIAIGFVLRFGWQVLPGLFVGDLVAALVFGTSPPAAVGIALAGVAEAVLASQLLLRNQARTQAPATSLRQVVATILLGAGLSPIVSVALGLGSMIAAGIVKLEDFWIAAAVWWTGDTIGILLMLPLLATSILMPGSRFFRHWSNFAALGLTGAVTALVFYGSDATTVANLAYVFLLFPFVVWAAATMTPRLLVWTHLVVAAVSLTATVAGQGPFSWTRSATDVWMLQGFIFAAVTTSLTLKAAIEDLRRSERLRREAELSAQARSAFLATVSHEVRTPLNGVLGMLELLAGARMEAEHARWVQVARQSGKTLLRIVNDVLDVSRFETGHIDLAAEATDVGLLAEVVAETVGQAAFAKGLAFSLSIDQRLATELRVDGTRLSQVLFNLVSNAVKFTETGFVRLELRVTQDLEKAQDVDFSISDSGPGISEAERTQLFKPYSRLGKPGARRPGGTGLGLFISQRLARAMGGRIELTSKPGKGSRFSFSLRLPRMKAPDHERLAEGKTALLMISGEQTRASVQALLEAWGLVVTRGPVAVASLCDAAQDLIVTTDLDLESLRFDLESAARPAAATAGRLILVSTLAPGAPPVPGAWPKPVPGRPLLPSALRRAIAALLSPAAPAGPSPAVASLRAAGAADGPVGQVPEARLLVADDHLANREVLRAQLGSLGIPADFVDDGAQALHAWEQGAYALLLTDCQMPGLDGYELAAAIRSREALLGRARKPIVAITGGALVEDFERCMAAGMDDYLVKPITLDELRRVLAGWLEGAIPVPPAKARAEASAPAAEPPAPVFDATALRSLADNPALVARILDAFSTTADSDFAALRAACAQCDGAQAERQLHRLLGAARSVGASRVACAAEALQQEVHRSHWDALTPGLDAIANALADFRAAASRDRRPPDPLQPGSV